MRGHTALVIAQIVLALVAMFRLDDYPNPGFEVDETLEVQSVEKDRDLARAPREGERVIAIDGVEVDTEAEYWYRLRLMGGDRSEVTLVSYNHRFHRSLKSDALDKGQLPSGLRKDDAAVGLRCIDDPSYAEFPRGIDIEALRQLLHTHAQDSGAYVSFNRPQKRESISVDVSSTSLDYVAGLLVLLGAVGMILVLLQAVRTRPPRDQEMATHSFYLSIQILLLSLAGLGLTEGLRIMSDPAIFCFSALGVAFFKPVNLEMHLRHRSAWQDLGAPTRLAIFAAPLIFIVQLMIASGSLLMMSWGSDVTVDNVAHIESLWTLLLAVVALMIVVDAGLLIVRHQRRGEEHSMVAVSSRIGLGFSLAALLVAVYFFARGGDLEGAGYAIFAAFVCQILGDIVGVLDLPRDYWRSSDPSQLFSRDGIRTFLHETGAALPAGGITYVVTVLENATVRFSLEPVGPHGDLRLAPSLAPQSWSILLDVLVTEGGYIPRIQMDPEGETDPVEAMAHKLGIYLVLPLYGSLRQSSARNYLIAAADLETNPDWTPPAPEMVLLPHLQALVSTFDDFEPAVIFQATQAAHHLVPLPEAPAPSKEEPADAQPKRVKEAEPGEDQRVLEARLRAMEAEIYRLHPIDDVETTEAQEQAVSSLTHAKGPVVLVGEAGVGKILVARLANARAGRGAFIRLAANELPAAVLELELFGGGEGKPGRFQAAFGGMLCIEAASRLTDAVYQRLFEALDALPEGRRPWLVLNCDLEEHGEVSGFSIWSARVEDSVAETVAIPPLRSQPDAIRHLAHHFLHRSAMRHGKVITDFQAEALEALVGYDWPGNMRELRDVIERAVLVCTEREVAAEDLQLGATDFERVSQLEGEIERLETRYNRRLQDKDKAIKALEGRVEHLERSNQELSEEKDKLETLTSIQPSRDELETLRARVQELEGELIALDATGEHQALSPDLLEQGSYEDIERLVLSKALERSGGNKSAAARDLGLKRSTFINKLNKHNIS